MKLSKADLACVCASVNYTPDAPFYKVDWPIRNIDPVPQLYQS